MRNRRASLVLIAFPAAAVAMQSVALLHVAPHDPASSGLASLVCLVLCLL